MGCDINPDCRKLVFDDSRIHVVVEDATDEKGVEAISSVQPEFDIIIEDGSHTSKDIVHSFATFFPKVRPGGTYIAEDLHCCYWASLGGGLGQPYSSIEFFKTLVDCINHNNWGRPELDIAVIANMTCRNYNIAIDGSSLTSIASIEFCDSLCIIKKTNGGETGRIATRVIGGITEEVVVGHLQLADKSLRSPDQSEFQPFAPAAMLMELTKLQEIQNKLQQQHQLLREEYRKLQQQHRSALEYIQRSQNSIAP